MADETSATRVNKFIGHTQWLLLTLRRIYPNNERVYRATNRVTVAATTLPSQILDVVGPQLLKYREQIKLADASSLLGADFKEDLQGNSEQVEYARDIIPLVQKAWPHLQQTVQDEVVMRVRDMLALYCEYMVALRAAARLKQAAAAEDDDDNWI